MLKGLIAAGCGWVFAGLLAVGGVGATAARGNSITVPQMQSVASAKVNWGPTALSFTKFDPSLGTLDAIDVTIEYTTSDTITMKFTSASTITVSSTLRSIELDRPDTTTIDNASLTDVTQTQTYSGPTFPNTMTFGPVTSDVTLPQLTLNSAGDLALFTGATASDPISLSASAFAHTGFSTTSGNGLGSALTKMGLNVTLQYEYTATVISPVSVPLPRSVVASLALLGMLAGVRRLRPNHFFSFASDGGGSAEA